MYKSVQRYTGYSKAVGKARGRTTNVMATANTSPLRMDLSQDGWDEREHALSTGKYPALTA